jgi:hypothetical protein
MPKVEKILRKIKKKRRVVRFPPNGRVQGGVYKIGIDLK